MKFNHYQLSKQRFLLLHVLVAGTLVFAACQPITDTRTGAPVVEAAVEAPAQEEIAEEVVEEEIIEEEEALDEEVTEISEEEVVDEVTEEDVAEEEIAEEEIAEEEIAEEEIAEEEIAEEEIAEEEIAEEEIAEAAVVEEETVAEETATEEVTEAEVTEAEVTEAEVTEDMAEEVAEEMVEEAEAVEAVTEASPAAEILLEPATATITARSLRVREAPDADSDVVAGAREGEAYPVIAISSDGAWVQLEIDRSPTGEGWVSSNFISLEGDITETATAPVAQPSAQPTVPAPFGEVAPPTATVDTRSLVVRAEPNEDGDVIAGLSLGDSFNVLGISPDGVWLQLELPEIEENAGWIQATFVRLAGDLTAIPTIGELAEVADDEVADEEDADAADEAGEETVTEAAPLPTTATTATVNARSLFVRAAPDAASDPVAGARQGESYRVIGVSADGLWVQIETARSETGVGWVFAEFVDLE